MFYFNLIKYYFAFKTRLKISDQKLPNFAAASCAKNYGDRFNSICVASLKFKVIPDNSLFNWLVS